MSSHRCLISSHSPKIVFSWLVIGVLSSRERLSILDHEDTTSVTDVTCDRSLLDPFILPPLTPSFSPSLLSHARQSLYKHDPLLFLLSCFARHQQRLSLRRSTPLSTRLFHCTRPFFFFPYK